MEDDTDHTGGTRTGRPLGAGEALVRFTAPDASFVPAGNPSPGLVRSALGRAGRLAANLASDAVAMAGLGKFVDGATVMSAGMPSARSPVLDIAARLVLAGVVGGFSLAFPSGAEAWDGQGRFQAGPSPGLAQRQALPAPVGPGGYGNDYAAREAQVQAWRQRREERRERRDDAFLAAGVGALAGAVVGGGLASSQGGYYGNGYAQPYRPYPPAPPAYYQPPAYPAQGYSVYGNGYGGGYGGGYRQEPRVPSDNFVLQAKAIVAAKLLATGQARVPGDAVRGADRLIDRAIHEGVACVRQTGAGGGCVSDVHGVRMDFATGRFVAYVANGPALEEVGGVTRRLRPDLLDEAYRRSMGDAVEARENGTWNAPRY